MICRYLFLPALILLGSIVSAQADDPTGWKDIPWGSKISAFEILEFGEVLDDPETEEFRGEKLTLEYEMEEYIVAGIPYVVKFYFDHLGAFSAYTLTYEGKEEPTRDAYEEIVRLLEERYKRISSPDGDSYRFGTEFLVISELEEVDADDDEDKWKITITYLDPNDGEADLL